MTRLTMQAIGFRVHGSSIHPSRTPTSNQGGHPSKKDRPLLRPVGVSEVQPQYAREGPRTVLDMERKIGF